MSTFWVISLSCLRKIIFTIKICASKENMNPVVTLLSQGCFSYLVLSFDSIYCTQLYNRRKGEMNLSSIKTVLFPIGMSKEEDKSPTFLHRNSNLPPMCRMQASSL